MSDNKEVVNKMKAEELRDTLKSIENTAYNVFDLSDVQIRMDSRYFRTSLSAIKKDVDFIVQEWDVAKDLESTKKLYDLLVNDIPSLIVDDVPHYCFDVYENKLLSAFHFAQKVSHGVVKELIEETFGDIDANFIKFSKKYDVNL